MAKLKKRVLRSKKENAIKVNANNTGGVLKEKMQSLVAEEKYADAMDVMAEIAQRGSMDTEIMYLGAVCYYNTGDYERSAKWLNNVLNYDVGHVKAHLLLGKVCLMEGRAEDGLEIIEAVLAQHEESLSIADKDDLESELYYYKYNATDELAAMPHIRAFLGISQEISEAEEQETAAEQHQEEELIQLTTVAEEIIAQVMAKDICLKEKVKLLNAFAAGCYQNQDYQAAKTVLEAALQIDSSDKVLLQNMIYTCIATGELDRAMALAGNVPMLDFGCLEMMKGI
ncbi:MAG: tetratricopeptide repeat protein [Selenomonadaceae bacterium]|nr:tetratricopeptide repeat protein [Selenomonadaceae bacterium]